MAVNDYIVSRIGGAHIEWKKSLSLSELIYGIARKEGKGK